MNAATETKAAKSTTITCDLYNPTTAHRVIYDGIPDSMKQIIINRGETKRGVTISKVIADELRERNRIKKDSDLIVKPQSTTSESEPVASEKTAA